MENKHHGSSSSNNKAENNSSVDEPHQLYHKLMLQFDQMIAGNLPLEEMTQTAPALAPMVNDDHMQIEDQMTQPNNLVETQMQLPHSDHDFQNYQLPNETEEEMVERLLAHVEHISRDFDQIHDEFQQQCAAFEAEFMRLGQLLEGIGGGSTAELAEVEMGYESDDDDDDAIAGQEDNAGEVGEEVEEATMEEEVVISSGLGEEEILENLNGEDFQAEHEREDICCICLGAYEGGEEKRKVGCGHMFHYECIRRWLLRKNSCPLCNRVVFNLQ